MKSFIKRIQLVLVIVLALSSCETPGADTKVDTLSEDHISVITLTKDQELAIGLQTSLVEMRVLQERIQANGYFDVPPSNRAMVSIYKGGFVKSTALLVGDKVQQGQVMATLQNSEYIRLQQDYLELQGQLSYLESEYERQKILAKEKINAKKNLLKAKSDHNTAKARYNGIKSELEMIGIKIKSLDQGNITSTIKVRAPISGFVTKVNSVLGKYHEPTDVLFEIINIDHIHLELKIYEKDIPKVKKGQQILITIPSMDNMEYKGKVHLVGKSLDFETRTINVHGHLENTNDAFLPGMYAEAQIIILQNTVRAVPVQAIVSSQSQQYIFIKSNEERTQTQFKRVPVSTGMKNDEWIEIFPSKNLKPDAQVVTKGAYYLPTEPERSTD
ncbi:MAG: efflux RND transporter periplasmic adaptor subunit [Reichenbachiella sp.]|uniref:efflux RND transporter periplasmic adaptor subunit n=1 Tax=Reichenbachiella sp. TaxID=2184521 RepID=UPI0032660EF3